MIILPFVIVPKVRIVGFCTYDIFAITILVIYIQVYFISNIFFIPSGYTCF